jgi:hypothetical protein
MLIEQRARRCASLGTIDLSERTRFHSPHCASVNVVEH